MKELIVHPEGESQNGPLVPVSGPVAVDTFGGRVHVEWDPQAAVTPLGQLPFFTEYLKVSGLFDPWVEECPLRWTSPNAPKKRAVNLGFSDGEHTTWRKAASDAGCSEIRKFGVCLRSGGLAGVPGNGQNSLG